MHKFLIRVKDITLYKVAQIPTKFKYLNGCTGEYLIQVRYVAKMADYIECDKRKSFNLYKTFAKQAATQEA